MILELLLLFVLFVLNGLLAMSEAAMISARPARLQALVDEGNAGAEAALRLSEEPTRFLSTTQIGITLVGILSGAIGGSTLSERIQPLFASIPLLAPIAETLSLGLVVVGITYMSLVIGELVPKQLALNQAERIAALIARPMQFMARIAAPVVSLLSLSTRLVLILLGSPPSSGTPVTEGEVKSMLEEGARAGAFEVAEQHMAENVFRMAEWEVRALMTPYPDMDWLDLDAPHEEIISSMVETHHDTYPVYRGDMRNPVGVVSIRDLWAQVARNQPLDLDSLMRTPAFVPETSTALQALELFQQNKRHMMLVIDEYGSVVGLVTALDILEAIVGNLPMTESPQALARSDGSWLADGLLPVDELETLLDNSLFPDEERRDYQTLSGFVMLRIDRIPKAGDTFAWGGYRFEVMDMDGHRVDKVLVAKEDDHEQQHTEGNDA